jgi:RNA polymerase sigma factor (sigma-70 family)
VRLFLASSQFVFRAQTEIGVPSLGNIFVRFSIERVLLDGRPMPDDGTLLREYAQSGSESAFAELVRRHLDLVYSTALHGVAQDGSLAQDVSQSVFIDLVRKAGALSDRASLAGWLYTSTCFAAAKAVRTEHRRRAREEKAQVMQLSANVGLNSADWEQIGPVLNRVMLQLKEKDREILVLRYFEQWSVVQIGQQLGLRESAARMRIERALERLRSLLNRSGITSTAAALALLLGQQTLVAAPIGLAASITSAAVGVSAMSGTSILSAVLMSKTKAILAGGLIALGAATPIVLQYQANAKLRAELAELRNRATAPTASQPIAAENDELAALRREHEELMRLRGEVALLRQRTNAPAMSQADSNLFERLKAAKLAKWASEAADAQVLLAKSPDIPMLPAKSWSNAGVATPAAALQTLNWAAANHDTNAFLSAMAWDPQVRARAEELFAALPESVRQQFGNVDGVIMDWMLSHATPMAAYRVLSQTEMGPDDVNLVEQHQYTDDRVRENTVQFHRDENGNWQEVLPPELMPKMESVINSLGSPTASTGK